MHYFFRMMSRRLKKNRALLGKILKEYEAYDPQTVNESLPRAYRIGLADYPHPEQRKKAEEESQTKDWLKRPYFVNRYKMPTYPCVTNDGTMVRSLGEAIIYNLLQAYGIPFRYDCEIRLIDENGNTVYRCPDFIIYLADGTILYWEHTGMLELDDYGDSFIKKLQLYNRNGIVIGDNLILTASGPKGAINAASVTEIIKTRILPHVSVQKTV